MSDGIRTHDLLGHNQVPLKAHVLIEREPFDLSIEEAAMYTRIDETVVVHGVDFDVMITPRNTEDDDEYFSIHIFRNDREPEEPGGEYEYTLSADALAEKLGVPHMCP